MAEEEKEPMSDEELLELLLRDYPDMPEDGGREAYFDEVIKAVRRDLGVEEPEKEKKEGKDAERPRPSFWLQRYFLAFA